MYQTFSFRTKLSLTSKGSLFIANTIVENLVEHSYGAAMFISSPELSVHLTFSDIHNCSCTSTESNFGETICVQNAYLFDTCYSCFSYNFCFGCPDVIVWGDSPRHIDFSSINVTSFCRSSSLSGSTSCSNMYIATLLTIYSINTSSMNANVRFSGFGFGSSDGTNIPKTSYALIDNGTTANYIIELYTISSSKMQVLDHFAIVNCAASSAVICNFANAKYILQFKDSVLSNISCPNNQWVDSELLSLSFSSSYIMGAPTTSEYAFSGSTEKWDGMYNWPNASKCRIRYMHSYEKKLMKAQYQLLLFMLLGEPKEHQTFTNNHWRVFWKHYSSLLIVFRKHIYVPFQFYDYFYERNIL